MALTLAQIRQKLKEQEDRKNNASSGTYGDGTVFPHWNIDEGQSVRIRFLPDADPTNSYFWVERLLIKLPFAGIKGQADSKPVVVAVPCIEMWPEMGTCPILAEVRTWFKDKDLEEMGRKYWKKKSYLFQGFIHENPMKEDKVPENPIRRFIISPQIYTLIKAALMDPELENLPVDYQAGLDFTITKGSKGKFADYNASKWARKESALTIGELEAIEKYGLFNLQEYLPKKPTAEELVIMKEMFDASVDGQAYDTDKWGKFFRPASLQTGDSEVSGDTPSTADSAASGKSSTPSSAIVVEPLNDHDETDSDLVETQTATAPVVKPDAVSSSGGSRAEDIINLIRNRQKPAS